MNYNPWPRYLEMNRLWHEAHARRGGPLLPVAPGTLRAAIEAAVPVARALQRASVPALTLDERAAIIASLPRYSTAKQRTDALAAEILRRRREVVRE